MRKAIVRTLGAGLCDWAVRVARADTSASSRRRPQAERAVGAPPTLLRISYARGPAGARRSDWTNSALLQVATDEAGIDR